MPDCKSSRTRGKLSIRRSINYKKKRAKPVPIPSGCGKATVSRSWSQSLRQTKLANDIDWIALVRVNRSVEAAHFGGRDFPGEVGERRSKLRKARQGLAAHNRDGLIRREVAPVVIQCDEIERGEKSIG